MRDPGRQALQRQGRSPGPAGTVGAGLEPGGGALAVDGEARITPLGAKMREETSRSLEKMLKQGAFTKGLEDLLKTAKGPLPTAPPTQLISKTVMRNIQPPQHAVDRIVGSDAPACLAGKPSVLVRVSGLKKPSGTGTTMRRRCPTWT